MATYDEVMARINKNSPAFQDAMNNSLVQRKPKGQPAPPAKAAPSPVKSTKPAGRTYDEVMADLRKDNVFKGAERATTRAKPPPAKPVEPAPAEPIYKRALLGVPKLLRKVLPDFGGKAVAGKLEPILPKIPAIPAGTPLSPTDRAKQSAAALADRKKQTQMLSNQ